MRNLTWAVVGLCVLMILPAMAAEEAGAAGAKVDRSTPKGALKSLFALAFAGKVDELAGAYVAPVTPEEKEMLEVGWSTDIYLPLLYKATAEKFGQGGGPDFDELLERVNKEVDGMIEEKVDENTAVLRRAVPPPPGLFTRSWKLVKVGSEWKMAIAPSEFMQPVSVREFNVEMRKLMLDMIADVKAGKFEDQDAMKKVLDERQRALMTKYPAGTQPASRPSSRPTSGPAGR